MQFWKEFFDAFKNGNFLKHFFMAASVTCFLNFWILTLSTYPHYIENSISVPKKASSKIGQSVDLIRRVMKSNNYGIHDGCIHKKLEECEYTYIYCASVKNYWLNLLGNFGFSDIITPHIAQLTSLLSEPACRLLEPIKIDYNFIEASDGFCFDTDGKKFIRNPKLKDPLELMCVTHNKKAKFVIQSRLLKV